MKIEDKKMRVTQTLLVLIILTSVITVFVSADPGGTAVSWNSTDLGYAGSPANMTEDGGTITTMVLNAVQQNDKWKAYLGNITGALTLDDSTGTTIFDWTLAASGITGEIYVTRASSVTWSSINCTTTAITNTEMTALGQVGTAVDSIRNTFNETTHPAWVTAGRTMPANTCNSTATFVSDARQNIATASFPEILMTDGTSLVYSTTINQDATDYNDGDTSDFQFIVADDVSAASTTYYFYAEISG